MYIYELPDWPNFIWDESLLVGPLAEVRHIQGKLLGRMEALGFRSQEEATLRSLTDDVLMTSEIEGQIFDPDMVRSSIARRLGLEIAGLKPSDRAVDGVVEMLLDATQNFEGALTSERLFDWHSSLFPGGKSGFFKINVGAWRDDSRGPMQVVSGVVGREKVHFQAPKAKSLDKEINKFLKWFEQDSTDMVLKSGIAHLWFLTLHPFDDGNGRIARAISDLLLARSEKTERRFYSMSAQIRAERSAYYKMLERTQKGSLNITVWLQWYLDCLSRAIGRAKKIQAAVIGKAHFWQAVESVSLNERQKKALNKILDGFEGKLTSSKYAKVAKCSQDTAHRDIMSLMESGILVKDVGGGRSTSYSLADR